MQVVRSVPVLPRLEPPLRRAQSALRNAPPFAPYLLESALLVAMYYGVAKLGFSLEFAGPVAAIVWLPVGVSIAFLYFRGLGFWPAVLVGDLLVNRLRSAPRGDRGRTDRRQRARGPHRDRAAPSIRPPWAMLGSVGGVARMLLAIAIGTALSATIGALTLLLGGVIQTDAAPRVWRTWWLGDFSGALVVVPFALAWWRRIPLGLSRARTWEALIVMAAVAGLTEVSFSMRTPVAYIVFPGLIWAAIRFGPRGATLALVIAVGPAIWNTVHYEGPFVFHTVTHAVLSTQLYIAVAAITTLVIAAVVAEREEYARRLVASRARLIVASDTERRRIERNLHDGAQQRLMALAFRLRRSESEARLAPEAAPGLIAEAEDELLQAVSELRELAHGIHPAVLTTLGLGEAIRGVASRSTVPVQVVEVPDGRLDDVVEGTAYFVVVEAISNAQKHARASSIRVRVVADAANLRIEVADDGVGGAVVRVGSGLEGLRDRVEGAGGTARIESPSTVGTRITAVLPLG